MCRLINAEDWILSSSQSSIQDRSPPNVGRSALTGACGGDTTLIDRIETKTRVLFRIADGFYLFLFFIIIIVVIIIGYSRLVDDNNAHGWRSIESIPRKISDNYRSSLSKSCYIACTYLTYKRHGYTTPMRESMRRGRIRIVSIEYRPCDVSTHSTNTSSHDVYGLDPKHRNDDASYYHNNNIEVEALYSYCVHEGIP